MQDVQRQPWTMFIRKFCCSLAALGLNQVHNLCGVKSVNVLLGVNAGGIVECGWVLQLAAIVHRHGRGRRIHNAGRAPYHRLRAVRP